MRFSRTTLFRLVLLLTPFLLLVTAELLLRLSGLFAPEPLFREIRFKGEEYYQVNHRVARRYFDPRQVSVPGVLPERLEKHKSPRTFRIFCLGGSTTAGFPFDAQVPFPFQLRYLLTRKFPHYRFEVINLGISAINSFSVWDLLPEVLEKEPDLILIYMGHNEFYGAYGSASTYSLGENGRFVRFYLRLQHFHLVQLVKRLVAFFRPAPAGRPTQKSLMAAVIKDRVLPYQGTKYRHTMRNFRDNLAAILSACRHQNVPVILGTLVSNLHDLPPFNGRSPRTQPDSVQRAVQRLLAEGQEAEARGNYRVAWQAYQAAFRQDSSAALTWYHLGKTVLALGDSLAAYHYLAGARDRDLIRFRASEEVNWIIRELAQRWQVGLADIEAVFRHHSPAGIPGNSLLCDHLHPNPTGYYLMARTFYQRILASGLLSRPDPQFQPGDQPYYVTPLDWDIGLLKIFRMVHRWPFPEEPVTEADYQPVGDSLSKAVALYYLFEENVWNKAHFRLAEAYLKQGMPQQALREYAAAAFYTPEDPYPFLQIARLYRGLKRWKESALYYQMALERNPANAMGYYQLALVLWKAGQLPDAIKAMERAIRLPGLNRREKQNARFYLAGFWADAGNLPNARRMLRRLLQEDPGFTPARQFLQKLTKTREKQAP